LDLTEFTAELRGTAATKLVERAVLLATPAVMPALSVGETADMAGLAARSTAGYSSCTGTIVGR
jgi:hypothetical protein